MSFREILTSTVVAAVAVAFGILLMQAGNYLQELGEKNGFVRSRTEDPKARKKYKGSIMEQRAKARKRAKRNRSH